MKEVLSHIQQVFGEVEVLESGTFPSGMAFPIHRLKLRTTQGPLDVVVKLYPAGFQEAFEREAWALQTLSVHQVPVPELLGRSALADSNALIMEWIEGLPLMDLLDQGNWMERFVKQLVQIHLPAERLQLQGTASEPGALHDHFENDFQKRYADVLDWIDHQWQDTAAVGPVLLHQDYHPWNVLVRPSEALVVLDWDWSVGDPREDVAWTRLILQKASRPDLAEMFTRMYVQQVPEAQDKLEVFDVRAHLRWLGLLGRPSAKAPLTDEALHWIRKLRLESHVWIREITGILIPEA